MPFHKFCNIKLGLLKDLHLADVAILDGEDRGSFPSDLVSNRSRDELFYQGFQVTLGSQLTHGGNHLGTNCPLLCGLGVASILDLVVLGSGERNAEQADHVTIGGLAVNITFNDGLLFADQTAKLVAGHVHTVEVHQTVVSLNILDTKLDLSVGQGFILVQVSKAELEDSSLQTVRGDLSTLCHGNQGLSSIFDGEDGGSNQFVPLFLQERVDGLFTATLLALC